MTIPFLNRIYKISTKAVQLIDPNVKVEFYKLRRDHWFVIKMLQACVPTGEVGHEEEARLS